MKVGKAKGNVGRTAGNPTSEGWLEVVRLSVNEAVLPVMVRVPVSPKIVGLVTTVVWVPTETVLDTTLENKAANV